MQLYQFLILLAVLILIGAVTVFLLIRLVLLRKKDSEKLGPACSSAVNSSISAFESRLNIRTDSIAAEHSRDIDQLRGALSDNLSVKLDSFGALIANRTDSLKDNLSGKSESLERTLSDRQILFEKSINDKQEALRVHVDAMLIGIKATIESDAKRTEDRFKSFESAQMEQINKVDASLKEIRETNERQLDSIRGVVSEKLQQTLNERLSESFKRVDERLEEVYKGLGEMQALATGVGDLKKVLSNVKTRGVLGEIQLRAILEEILAPEQYELNFDPGKGTNERVEFAIRLPNDGNPVYLPIDSKFPSDMYLKLTDAYESGNSEMIESARRSLRDSLIRFAKDIFDKYINPPRTTNFAVMFLPTEGLYAEAVRLGLIESLQSKYRINIAGPSTMAALLNSLQMGFRTLAIQKRSAEVWELLSKIKKEFSNFDDVLTNTRKALKKADDDLEKLIGTRTKQIRRALSSVEELPSGASAESFPSLTDAVETVLPGDTDDID